MKETFFKKMNLRDLSVIFMMIAMAIILLSMGSVDVLADTDTPNYGLDLRPNGTVYKMNGNNPTADDISAEIKEKGLYYDSSSSKWIMEDFSFTTTNVLAINCGHNDENDPAYTFVIKGENTINSGDTNNHDTNALWCLYSDLTFEGDGEATFQAGNTTDQEEKHFPRSSGIAIQHSLTINGPTIYAKGGKATYGYSRGISMNINGQFNLFKGHVYAEADDAGVRSYGLYSNIYNNDDNINISGGTFTARDNSTSSNGTFYGIYTVDSYTNASRFVNTNLIVKNGARVDITGSDSHKSYALYMQNAEGYTNSITIEGTRSRITANCPAKSNCLTAFDTICVATGTLGDLSEEAGNYKIISLNEGKIVLKVHKWNSGIVTKKATETTNGKVTYTCLSCGKTKIYSTSRLSHMKGTHHEAVDATCITKGSVEYWDCRNCDQKLDEDGKVIPDISTELVDHIWNDGKVITASTCVKEGSILYTCTVDGCGATKTETLPVNGKHNYGAWKTTKASTVFTCGTAVGKCTFCGKKGTKSLGKLKATIKLSRRKITLRKGKTYTVKVTYARGDSVKSWKSSKKKVAKVTKKGKIIAKKKGKAKIKVTLKSGKKATVIVKVK